MRIRWFFCMAMFVWLCGSALAGQPTVRSVEVKGAHGVSASDVKAQMVMRAGMPLDSTLVRRDIARVLALYRDRGFWQVKVAYPEIERRGDQAVVRFAIVEGRSTRVDSVRLGGDQIFAAEDLRAALGFGAGAALVGSDLNAHLEDLLQFYADRGYPLCTLHPDVRFGGDGATAVVSVQVDSGPLVHVDTVRFEGNRVTRAGVLRRQMGLRTGDVYRQQHVDRAVDRLRRLPFLQSVDAPELVREQGRTALVVRVREARSARVDGGVGLAPGANGTGQVLTGTFVLDVQNLAGAGREGHVAWTRTGPGASDLRLRYREPWVLGGPLSGRIQVDRHDRPGYAETVFSLGADIAAFDGGTLSADVGRSQVLPDSSGFGRYLKSDAWTLTLGAQEDRRDDVWNPRTGWLARGATQLSRVQLPSSTVVRRRYDASLQGFRSIGQRSVLMLGAQGQWVRQPGGVSEDALLRLGGAQTIRGYREEAFLATSAAWMTAEWRVLFGPRSRVFAFVDAGTVQETTRLYPVGYGIGILAESRLGAIGLDFAFARGEALGEGKVHVRLVNAF